MFKKRGAIKRRARRGKRNIRRKPKLLALNPAAQNVQKAVCVETYDAGILASNAAYMNQITITRCPRAMAMAKLFKFYRCKRVIYEYRPDQNTFQAGAGQTAIPYAYYIMNRSGMNSSGQSLPEYLAMGARPIKFTQKILISYKPNTVAISDVLASQIAQQNVTVGRTPLYDKWYSTDGLNFPASYIDTSVGIGNPAVQPANNMAVVQYFGHDIFFQQQAPAEADIGNLSITVEWEFKVPNYVILSNP